MATFNNLLSKTYTIETEGLYFGFTQLIDQRDLIIQQGKQEFETPAGRPLPKKSRSVVSYRNCQF